MAFSNGPRIIEDKLILYSDAANPQSYIGTGTAINDLSATGNNGTSVNMTFSTEAGGCFDLDGTDDYISIADSATLDLPNNFTISMWFNGDSWNPNDLMMHRFNAYGMGYDTNFVGGTDDKLHAYIYNGSSWISVSTTTQPSAGVWYCMTMTYDGSNLKVYLNGVLEGTQSTGTGPLAGTSPLTIGTFVGSIGPYAFQGKISNYKIYTQTLTASEILQNYNSQKSRFGK